MKETVQKELTASAKRRLYAGWIAKRALLAAFDVVVSYAAFYFALVIRFVANHRFLGEANEYLEAFYKFLPWYALLTIVVFAAFGLYTSRWKYAGFYDVMRIVYACAVLLCLNYAGTRLLFIRMPLSFYCLGIAMQFIATCIVRFLYPIYRVLLRNLRKGRSDTVNVMLAGVGDTANYVRTRIEAFTDNNIRIACVFSDDSTFPKGRINGAPVLTDADRLADYVKQYRLSAIFIADPAIAPDLKHRIKDFCRENDLDYQDYSDALRVDPYNLYLSSLLKHARCPVRLRIGEETQDYPSGEEALTVLQGAYIVRSFSADESSLIVEAVPRRGAFNDADAEWVRETEEQTGAPISFF